MIFIASVTALRVHAAEVPEGVMQRFFEALNANDRRAVSQLLSSSIDEVQWAQIRYLLDRYKILRLTATIEDIERGPGQLTITAHVEGTGTPYAREPLPETLPARWRLHLTAHDDSWQIDEAESYEAFAARKLLDATPALRDSLWEQHRGMDQAALRHELAMRIFTPPRVPQFLEAARWVETLCRQAEDRKNLGIVLRAVGTNTMDHDDVLREALSLAEGGSLDDLALAKFALGKAELRGGQSAGFVRLQEAASMADSLSDATIALKSMFMLAHYHGERHEYSEVLKWCTRLIAEAERFGWVEGKVMATLLLGDLYLESREYSVASSYYERALREGATLSKDAVAASALYDLAVCKKKLGHDDEAVPLFQQSLSAALLSLSVDHQNVIAADMASSLIRLGRLKEAEATLTDAIERSESLGWTLEKIALLYTERSILQLEQGRASEALATAKRAATLAVPSDPSSDWSQSSAHTAAGRALRALGRRDEAIAEFVDAIQLIEQDRAALQTDPFATASFLQDYSTPYLELVDLLTQKRDLRGALEVVERLKGRTLSDTAAGAYQRLVDATMTPEVRSLRQTLDQKIFRLNRAILIREKNDTTRAALQKELDESRVELDALLLRVRLQEPRQQIVFSTPGDLRAAFQMIPVGGAILDYAVLDDRTLVFIVTKHDGSTPSLDVVSCPISRNTLRDRVRRLSDAIEERKASYSTVQNQLYSDLLRPVLGRLKHVDTLCIIPHEVLWLLPFHALGPTTGDPLLRHYSIFYAPSMLALREERHSPSPSPKLLAFGDPSFEKETVSRLRGGGDRGQLGRLPDAADEVKALGELYPSSRIETSRDASEGSFKRLAGDYSILHIASHAILDDAAPQYSALLFAAGPHDDGLLETREILDLDLHADLAVLSACDTGRGAIDPGEGIVGISWAFMMAGCPTTVASQWRAESKATAALMVAFHRELLKRGMKHKAEALRQAELQTLQNSQWRHPMYWAPFIVIGDGW